MNLLKTGVLLASTSIANVAATALLGFLLAGFLSREDFGVTRVVSAYMIILTVLGTFTIHDALASHVAKTQEKSVQKNYFVAASVLVVVISAVVAISFSLYLSFSSFYEPKLASTMFLVSISLPFACLSIVYAASLQSLENHFAYALITLANGIFPLILILPLSQYFDLTGWTIGRISANLCLFIVGFYVIRKYIGKLPWRDFERAARSLWQFSRIQVLSGILSLVMLSADIVMLERLATGLDEVANYGLAALFARSFIILSSTLGKMYFKRIALVVSGEDSASIVWRFLVMTQALALLSSIALLTLVPGLIKWLYGEKYILAVELIPLMSIGLFFSFAWNSISLVNIALARTKDSMLISFFGAGTGVTLLLLLIPSSGAIGAVWAMNTSYLVGVAVGIFLLYRSGYLVGSARHADR